MSASEDAGGTHSAFGAGFEIGDTWLLGARRNIGLSPGVGLTRLSVGGEEAWPGVLPTVRLLNVGVAFQPAAAADGAASAWPSRRPAARRP